MKLRTLIAATLLVSNSVQATTWEIIPAIPPNLMSWSSLVSNAVGISDNGFIVGTTEQWVFAFDGLRFGGLQISGGINYPTVSGVTKDGWVWGYGTTNIIPWGGNVETADWQPVGGYVVNCCSTWNSPPTPILRNGSDGLTQELLDFLNANNMTFVGMNPSGQVVANGYYDRFNATPTSAGYRVAFLLNPIEPVSSIPEPTTLIMVLAGVGGIAFVRRKTTKGAIRLR